MKPERETLTHNVKGEYKLKDNTAVSSMGSDAAMSTLDWSHIRETVRFLNLAVAHIEDSMSEGDESVEALTDSFTTIAYMTRCTRLSSPSSSMTVWCRS